MNNSLESTAPVDANAAFQRAALAMAEAGLRIWQQGWAPATSGNFSMRLDDDCCAITVSGRDKGRLRPEDIMRVDFQGRPLDNARPSAETLLHTRLYRRDPDIGAILHTHSITATLVSMHAPVDDEGICLAGLELLKAFAGTDSHTGSLQIPVFDNSQDIAALAARVDAAMDAAGTGHAYLIRGHGLYTWGRDLDEAMRHLEALEYLLEYHWRSRLAVRA